MCSCQTYSSACMIPKIDFAIYTACPHTPVPLVKDAHTVPVIEVLSGLYLHT